MTEAKERRSGRVPTGLFIRNHLLTYNEAHTSQIHRALHEEYDGINQGRKRGERLRPPTFHSFLNYLQQMKLFGLVELSGRGESMDKSEAPWLSEGVISYYQLTAKGRADPPHAHWVNWRRYWEVEGYPKLD